jgi:hypothetical protein
MSIDLRVGQILRCVREHYGVSSKGLDTVSVDDIMVVTIVTGWAMGRAARLSDGLEFSITTLNTVTVDYKSAAISNPYVEVLL